MVMLLSLLLGCAHEGKTLKSIVKHKPKSGGIMMWHDADGDLRADYACLYVWNGKRLVEVERHHLYNGH
jgi:hypothetical protein